MGFARFEAMSEATQFLIKIIKDRLGVKIDYRPGDSSMEITMSSGEYGLVFFGETKKTLQNMAFEDGISAPELLKGLIIRDALERGDLTIQYTENGGVLLIFQNGKFVESYNSVEEYELTLLPYERKNET